MEVQAVNPGEFKHKANAVAAHNLCTKSERTTTTSTNLTEPVIKMEATRIYSDSPDTKSSH